MDKITQTQKQLTQPNPKLTQTRVFPHQNFAIAADLSGEYEVLTEGDPEKIALLREAIIRGIRLKQKTVNPLTQREIDELQLALYYIRRSHGTDGHHRLTLLGKFATLLDITLEGETTLKGFESYAQ